jgi:DNA-binding transcriptional ArsR family regulator
MAAGMAAGAGWRRAGKTPWRGADSPDLLDRIQEEIRERLDASREAVREYERLQAALEALDGAARPASRGDRTQTPTVARTRARRRVRPAGSRRRAPRGANRDAVLRVVGERPGITTSELAAASGVAKPTLYALLSSLTKQGVLQRQQLPGGQSGYRVRAVDGSATGRPEGVRESTEP